MKLQVKWFTLALVITGVIPSIILFTWCALNGFGEDLVRMFESIHPAGGFSAIPNSGLERPMRLVAALINTLYSMADLLIAGVAFSSLYNFFLSRGIQDNHDDQ